MENALVQNEKNVAKTPSKKFKKPLLPFSPAIFFESLKSNWKNVLGVGLANSLLIIIIVGILSTLSVNATSNALRNMFDSASTESSVKGGAVSYYQAYTGVADGYETLNSSVLQLQTASKSAIDKVSDSSTGTSFNALKILYRTTYTITAGDAGSKKAAAKNAAVNAGVAAVDNQDISAEEKDTAKEVVRRYFDVYAEDENKAHADIMKEIMPGVVSDALSTKLGLNDEDKASAKAIIEKAIKEVYPTDGSAAVTSEKASYEAAFSLGELAAKYVGDGSQTAVFDELKAIYLRDPDKYVSDSSYRTEQINEVVSEAFINTAESNAYYGYLPTFEVLYQTSELGWPVTYLPTGEKDTNGNDIVKQTELKSYRPDLFQKKDGELGTPATMMEKMRKEALTGKPYTDEEIATAKAEAKDAIEGIKEDVNAFIVTFSTRDEKGANAYYSDGKIDYAAIEDTVVEKIVDVAGKTYVKTYNDKYGTSYETLLEIPGDKGGMSGASIQDTIASYANAGIAAYKRVYANKIKAGYSETDSQLIAASSAGQGVMDQLPTDVGDSLNEMGDMNTYAIITGKVGFAIACLLIPMIYSVMLATSLVSQKVENGSLAFTFSTPLTRQQFVFTEGCFLILSQIFMGLLLGLGALACRGIGIAAGSPDLSSSLSLSSILYYTLGNMMVTLAMSAVSFFASCYFNKSGYSLGVGAGFVVFSFLCTILGLFGSKAIPSTTRIELMNFFNFITPISLFDAMAVMDGEMGTYWIKLSGLLLISVVGYLGASVYFTRKDLPL